MNNLECDIISDTIYWNQTKKVNIVSAINNNNNNNNDNNNNNNNNDNNQNTNMNEVMSMNTGRSFLNRITGTKYVRRYTHFL